MVNVTQCCFWGSCNVCSFILFWFQVAGDLNSISLHKDISVNVDNSSITIAPTIAISSTTYEDATQVYTIKLQTEMANVSTYTIQIPFSGTLRQDNLGLHVGSYTYNNITRYVYFPLGSRNNYDTKWIYSLICM